MHGAADALFEEFGLTPELLEARVREASLRELREAMGEVFDPAYATGRQLELDAAVDLALHLP